MPRCITLLTDFGSSDTYVGQMKGAVLSVYPQAQLVDLTHAVSPGDIRSAALLWADAVAVFPAGTVHLAVVDPGVGSARGMIAAEINGWRFVCPDNGLLTHLLQRWPLQRSVRLTERRWWRDVVSPVFHGRDIFGPVAGHWAAGRDLTDFGSLSDKLPVMLPCAAPVLKDNRLIGTVQQVDRFGNLVTDIATGDLKDPYSAWRIQIGSVVIHGIHRCYSEQPVGSPLALIGSQGRLEIAINQGHAAQHLVATVGTRVTVWHDRENRLQEKGTAEGP